MKNLLCLTGFAFFAHSALSQEYKIEPVAGELIAPLAGSYVGGNSYIISGKVYQGYDAGMIYRTDATSLAWAKSVFAVSELQGQTITSNGDVVSVGQANSDALIVRLNQSGATLWTKTIGNNGSLVLMRGVMEDASGNLVVVGSIRDNSTNDESELVIKLDPSGNMLWSREVLPPFGSVDPANRFNKVIVRNDTIFAFGTRFHSLSPADISIGKFSSDGNYSEFYTVGSVSDETFCDVTMSGQDFVISCLMAGPNSYTGLIRLNPNLSMNASVQLTPTLGVGTLGMIGGVTSFGNNFIISGERNVSGSKSFAAAVDQNFSPVWAEIVKTNAVATVKPIIGPMGQVMVVGYQGSFGAVMSAVDAGSGFPVMGFCEPPQAFGITKTPTFLYSVSIIRSAIPVNFTNIGTVTLVPYQPGFDLCGASTLPMHLLSFTAKAVGHEVLLEWATATEQNNDHFTVERSRDGQTFEEVVRVNGAGNSVSTQSYDAVDHHPHVGESYYRLKQTDTDGAYTHSEIVPVTVDAPVELVVYPNPIANGKVLNLPSEAKGYEIRDAMARLVNVVYGATEINGLSSGWYTVQSIEHPELHSKLLVTF